MRRPSLLLLFACLACADYGPYDAAGSSSNSACDGFCVGLFHCIGTALPPNCTLATQDECVSTCNTAYDDVSNNDARTAADTCLACYSTANQSSCDRPDACTSECASAPGAITSIVTSIFHCPASDVTP